MARTLDYDVIFVGAGVGSLIASILTARKGLKTAIFEKQPMIGGRAVDVIEYQGYHLETTGHASTSFYLGEAMQETGVELKLASVGARVYLVDECEFAPIYSKWDRDSLVEILKGPEFNVAENDVPKVVKVLSKLRSMSDEEIVKLKSTRVQDWLDAEGIEPAVARVLKMFMTIMALCFPVEEGSIGEALMFFKDMIDKGTRSLFPNDSEVMGYRGIGESFASAALQNGVEIQTEKRVTEVLVENGTAKGVVIQDSPCGFRSNIGLREEVSGGRVVCNLQAWDITKIIDESLLSKELVENGRKLREYNIEAVDVWCGMKYLPRRKCDGKTEDFPGWNRFLIGPDRLFGGGYMFTTLHQPKLAPPGKHLFLMRRALRYGTMRNNDFRKAQEIAKIQMDYVRSAYLDFDEAVEWERIAVHWPYCWPTYWGAPVQKLPIRCPDIRNLYFVGDSTEAKGMCIDRAACSGLYAGRALLEDAGR